LARQLSKHRRFHEVHVAADLDMCEARDPKGRYRRARVGELLEFTGIDAPYEAPEKPELTIATGSETDEESIGRLCDHVVRAFPTAALHITGDG
jgi:adenylylsulfate kinase